MSAQEEVSRAFGGTAWLFPVLIFATVLLLVWGPGAAHAEIGHTDVAFAAMAGGAERDGSHAGECHPDGHCVATAALPLAPETSTERLCIADAPRPLDVRLHSGIAPGPGHRPPIFAPQA